VGGISLFIKNLNYLVEEIQIEIIKKNQLSYWLRGLNIIVIIPLFLPPIIENWAKASFPAVSSFYNSYLAFYAKSLIFLVIVVCYAFIAQIQRTEYSGKTLNKKTWDFYASEVPEINFIVKFVMPDSNTVKHRKTKVFIEESGADMSIEGLYLRRILCALSIFLLVICVFWAGHRHSIETIKSDPQYGIKTPNFLMMLGKLSADEETKQASLSEGDIKVINAFRKVDLSVSPEAAKTDIVRELSRMNYQGEDSGLVAERIYAKMVDIGKERLKLWEVFVSLLLGALSSFFPLLILAFRSSLRKLDMEDETFQFQTIIILLMHHDRVDVRVVLEWMKEFANVFLKHIEVCLGNFQESRGALEKLKQSVSFKPFVKLIDNLEMANGDIPLKLAFDSLELDRDFYKENRKETNKQQISRRIEFGQMIGFVPIHTVLGLYLALPILTTSFTAFSSIQKQLM